MFSATPFYEAFGLPPETASLSQGDPASFRLGELAELVITPTCCSLILCERSSHDLAQAALARFGTRAGLAVAQTTGGRLCFHWSEDAEATQEAQVLREAEEILDFLRSQLGGQ